MRLQQPSPTRKYKLFPYPTLFQSILRDNAADDLGILVHPATSNEECALLARLAEALGTGNLDHRIAQHDLSDGASAEAFGMPVAGIENADVILIVGKIGRAHV